MELSEWLFAIRPPAVGEARSQGRRTGAAARWTRSAPTAWIDGIWFNADIEVLRTGRDSTK
jgi:hypothetical protein